MSFRQVRIIAIISIFLAIVGSASATPIMSDFVEMAQDGQLILYGRPTDGQIIVYDKIRDLAWFSNPDVDVIEDYEFLSNIWQGNLQSPFYFEFFDARRNVRGGNAYSHNPEIIFKPIEQGFQMTYYYPDLEIGFTVQYELVDSSLLVTIPWEYVKIGGDLRLLSLRILPFLGAQPSKVDLNGYLFVPDGSGGLIRFKEIAPLSQAGFNEWVYGPDPASAQTSFDPYREPVTLPVFGLKALDQAFLGIIEQGHESAKILATPGGVVTELNWTGAELYYSQPVMMRTSRTGSGIRVYDENPIPGDRAVRFYFLAGEEANYVGMAKQYRRYLQEYKGVSRFSTAYQKPPMLIQLFGADYERSAFGRVIQPMTTFEQAAEIVDVLRDQGVDQLLVSYRGWNDGGIYGNLPKRFPAERTLGGNDGLRQLATYLAELQIPLILEDDYSLARGSRNGFQPSAQASRTSFNDLIQWSLGEHQIISFDQTTYVISPRISLDYASRDLPQVAQLGAAGILFHNVGDRLYSDHNPNSAVKTQRRDACILAQELLQLGKEQVGLVGVTTGNAYSLGGADFVAEVSMETTRDLFMDEPVPFWQIAAHGLVMYFAKPVNLSTNPTRDLLRTVEYGALPSFILTAEPTWKLRYTRSNHLHSTHYLDWLDEIERQYGLVNSSMHKVYNLFIDNHEKLAPDVYATTYEDGTIFVVNYGTSEFVFQDVVVDPQSFKVLEREGLTQ